jgi:hypothetical protein
MPIGGVYYPLEGGVPLPPVRPKRFLPDRFRNLQLATATSLPHDGDSDH